MFKIARQISSICVLSFLVIYYWLNNQAPATQLAKPAEQSKTPTLQQTPLQFHPKHPENFAAAKQILKQIYPTGREIYCGCSYDLSKKDRIDEASCGFRGKNARAERIEWEHVVPASIFGRQFVEWKAGHPNCRKRGHMEKGRDCARENSPDFRKMEADLYNLLPSIGELNGARSNLPFGDVPGEARQFGGCDFEKSKYAVEPPPAVRGDIARIYFYMDARYPSFSILNKDNEKILVRWDVNDPIDDTERARIAKIEEIQGNSFYIGRLQKLSRK